MHVHKRKFIGEESKEEEDLYKKTKMYVDETLQMNKLKCIKNNLNTLFTNHSSFHSLIKRDNFTFKGVYSKINGKIEIANGHCVMKDGSCYKGFLVNWKYEDFGKFYKNNSYVYEGLFRGGLFDGCGIVKFKNGFYYKGTWSNNLPHGKGEIGDDSGVIAIGTFHKGSFVEANIKRNLPDLLEKSSCLKAF